MIDINITLPNATPPQQFPPPKLREFLTPLPAEGHYLAVFDNSALEHITKCPTSAFNYLLLKRQQFARNAALTFGGSIHEGIKDLLLGKSDEEQNQSLARYFIDNPGPPDEYRTLKMALRVLANYRERYQLIEDFQFEVLLDEGLPLVEVPFEIPLGAIDVNTSLRLPDWPCARDVRTIHVAWSGRMDLLAKKNGKNRVIDHKTTSVAGDQYIQSFQLSHQAMGYTWVSKKLWPELDISGFCLNGIGLRRVKDDTASLTTPGPKGGEPPLTFFRSYYDYSQNQLDQWEENALNIISDFIHCIVRGFFPQYTNSCFGKYGKCQYHDACTIENKQVRTRFLMSDSFQSVHWDPTL